MKIGACVEMHSVSLGTGDQHFSVDEFVELADGTRVVIDERGFSVGLRPQTDPGSPSQIFTSLDELRRQVLDVVLPDDDAEALEQDHPWEHLAECAQLRGLSVTADDLRALPEYVVEFSPGLHELFYGR